MRRIILVLLALYVLFLLVTLKPPEKDEIASQVEEFEKGKNVTLGQTEDIILIANKLGFLDDSILSDEEIEISNKVYSLYKYRTTLFDDVLVDDPRKFGELSERVTKTLQNVPVPLRDDMIRFLFSEAPYTLKEFSVRVELFEMQVNEFLQIYKKLPRNIKKGIENSKRIYEVKNFENYTSLIKKLEMTLEGFPPEVVNAIDEMKGIIKGFEPNEILEFLRGAKEVREKIYANITYKEWFLENSWHYNIDEIHNSWEGFVKAQLNDKEPPKFKGTIESLPSGLIEIMVSIKDQANPPKKIEIYLNRKKKLSETFSTQSLSHSYITSTFIEWGDYNITVKVFDAKGNYNYVEVFLQHYPLIFPIEFGNEAKYSFQKARLYSKEEIEYMWRKAVEYKPLQLFKAVYPELGFERYDKIRFGSMISFFYEDAKKKLLTYYDKPLTPYSINALHIATFVNDYVHSFNLPVIKTLESTVCGYDGETELILMNNLFMDFNIKAWAIQIPASIEGKNIDHSEVVVLWRAPLLVGSNYKGIFILGKDPYLFNPQIYPFEEGWPEKYTQDTVGIMTLGLLPYRPEQFALKEFYERFGIKVTPAYPLKNLEKEFIKGYELFFSYISFQISQEYLQKLLNMTMEGELKILDELNKLEAARELWYRLDGYKLYSGLQTSYDYVFVDGEGNFYYVHKSRSRMFSSS